MPTSPFFIVGCGRSGTTLLRTMLNQHSKVAIPLESLFITDYLRAKPGTPPDTFHKLILDEYELHEWGMPFAAADFDGCVTAQDFIDRAHALYVRLHSKEIWGQKTPRFVRFGALLKHHYPQAKFINIQRDPRAVVSSLIRSNVHHSNALFAARRWLRDTLDGEKLAEDYPGDVLAIRYEDLVSDPDSTLRQVCAFLGLDFEPALLEYHTTGTAEYSGYYTQIHENLNAAPDPSRIEAWRKHLSPREVALIESICGEMMLALGYAPDATGETIPASYLRRLRAERVTGLAQQILHNFRTRRGYLTSFLRRKRVLALFWNALKDVNY